MEQRERHETLPGVERDPWLNSACRAVFCCLDKIYMSTARTDALLERANNIAQALCLGTLTIAESEAAVWDALGVDNGAGALPVELRGRAVKAILRAWLEVRPEPVEPEPAIYTEHQEPDPVARRIRMTEAEHRVVCALAGYIAEDDLFDDARIIADGIARFADDDPEGYVCGYLMGYVSSSKLEVIARNVVAAYRGEVR